MLIAELVQQCLTLSLAQPPNAPARGDLELLHHGRGADLADTGQRLQQRGNLQLGNGFVVLGVVQNLLQGGTSPLEPPLELGAGPAGGRGLLQCRSTLLIGQRGHSHVSLIPSSMFDSEQSSKGAVSSLADLTRSVGGHRG